MDGGKISLVVATAVYAGTVIDDSIWPHLNEMSGTVVHFIGIFTFLTTLFLKRKEIIKEVKLLFKKTDYNGKKDI